MLDFGVGSEKIFMTSKKPISNSVFAKLIEPLEGLVDKSKLKRKCKTLSDQIETNPDDFIPKYPSIRATGLISSPDLL